MSGKIIRQGHVCSQPSAQKHTPGTVWQCDCGRNWGVTVQRTWEPVSIFDLIMLNMADSMAAGRRKPADPS